MAGNDLELLDGLIADQEKVFLARTGESQRIRQECADVLPGGVASNWQDAPPGAVWIDHGAGSHVFDVDGTDYVDMHGGFGVGIVGHAHPAVVAAVSDRVRKGTHFAQPTTDSVVVARDIITSGNTSSASIPIALTKLIERGEVTSGEPVLIIGFGAGLTYAAQVILAP